MAIGTTGTVLPRRTFSAVGFCAEGFAEVISGRHRCGQFASFFGRDRDGGREFYERPMVPQISANASMVPAASLPRSGCVPIRHS